MLNRRAADTTTISWIRQKDDALLGTIIIIEFRYVSKILSQRLEQQGTYPR